MTRYFVIFTSLCVFALSVFFVGVMVFQAFPNVTDRGWELLSVGLWDYRKEAFGAFTMIWGSACVAIIALLLAFPVGLGSAIFVSEYLHGAPRAMAKVSIELLAGVPSVVYGLLGVAFLRSWLSVPLESLGGVSGDTLITAGILLAVMILPTMMSFTDDALRCVPRSYRETAWGLGLSRTKGIFHVVVPHARAGIIGAAMLSMGRAIGETIAVYLVVGRSDRPVDWENPLSSLVMAGQTLTTKLGGSEVPIAYGDSQHWAALMGLGVILWIGIGSLTYSSEFLVRKVGAREI